MSAKTFSLSFVLVALLISSCGKVKNKVKDGVNTSGEMAGEAVGEFFEGADEGYTKTLECDIRFSEKLAAQGLETGKFKITGKEGNHNNLSLYVIFNKPFSDTVMVKVFHKDGDEIGRVKQLLNGKKDEARYVDFTFSKQTYIEAKSVINIE